MEKADPLLSLRGVTKPGSMTLTTHFSGTFRDDPNELVRFMSLVREK